MRRTQHAMHLVLALPIVCLSPGFASASEPRATAHASQVVVPDPIDRSIATLSTSHGLRKS